MLKGYWTLSISVWDTEKGNKLVPITQFSPEDLDVLKGGIADQVRAGKAEGDFTMTGKEEDLFGKESTA